MSDGQLSPTFSDWGGPYIIAATFCERVLIEQNGMSSIIRLQQRVQIPLVSSADTPVAPIQISMALVVQLATSTATGKQTLTIT